MKKATKALGHGIKTFVTATLDRLIKLFGMNDNSKYGKVLRQITGTAFTLIVTISAATMLIAAGHNVKWKIQQSSIFNNGDIALSKMLSDNLFYYKDYYTYEGYLADSNGRKLLKNITRIATPIGDDSLAYFSNGDKRGYFHMRDGRQVVKPTYQHAWVFSEGLAAVEINGLIKFIDTSGRVVIDRGFRYDYLDDYVFHNGHCAVRDSTGKHMGLIDRNGNWVLSPKYTYISPEDTFWVLKADEQMGLLTFEMDTVMPLNKYSIAIIDTTISVTYADHTQHTFDLQGNILIENQIRNIERLTYSTNELENVTHRVYDEASESYNTYNEQGFRQDVATCMKYEAAYEWYGLMGYDGKIITPPLYYSIEAIDKDIYLCKTSWSKGILLNSKGEQVE